VKGLLLDTNLLLLLVVGLANEAWIEAHKKLDAYNLLDYEVLRNFITNFETLCVTPNTLTECSNLSRQIKGDAKRGISLTLGKLIRSVTELHVRSIEICEGEDCLRLGLTDAVLLALMKQDMTLLTADHDLYQAACGIDPDRATNFNHLPHRSGIQ
jgi:predicted nucleic acid-binding protein